MPNNKFDELFGLLSHSASFNKALDSLLSCECVVFVQKDFISGEITMKIVIPISILSRDVQKILLSSFGLVTTLVFYDKVDDKYIYVLKIDDFTQTHAVICHSKSISKLEVALHHIDNYRTFKEESENKIQLPSQADGYEKSIGKIIMYDLNCSNISEKLKISAWDLN